MEKEIVYAHILPCVRSCNAAAVDARGGDFDDDFVDNSAVSIH